MRQWAKRKPLIRYRFKDSSGFVVFETFTTDREARIWYENHKIEYGIKEFQSAGPTYKSKILDTMEYF